MSDEYPIKYEAERLPPPIVADLNGDGKKEVLVATHDAKIQVWIFICLHFLFWIGRLQEKLNFDPSLFKLL